MKKTIKNPKAVAKKSTKSSALTATILAIDLGKYKSVACVYPTGAEVEIRYSTFDTSSINQGLSDDQSVK